MAALLVAIVASCATASPSPSPAPTDPANGARAHLAALAASRQFAGAVLVAKDGKVVFRDAVGQADAAAAHANTPDTRFRIGSITKAFTATGIMLLESRGALGLEDRICDHVARCPATWCAVTVREALTHTSGVADYLPLITLEDFDRPTPPDRLVDLVRAAPLAFAPGGGYLYSNTNYVLLGLAAEQASRMTWEAFVQREIFDRLGMAGSGYSRDFTAVPGHANGYGFRTTTDDEVVPTAQAAWADGGLYSTVDDLLRFDQVLYGSALLPTASIARQFTPWGGPGLSPDYHGVFLPGLGWNLQVTDPTDRLVYHGGQIPGFNAALRRYIDRHLTVIVLSNQYWSRADAIADDLAVRFR